MADWPIQFDDNSRPEDVALAGAIDELTADDETKGNLYACLCKPDWPMPAEDLPTLQAMYYQIQAGQVPMLKKIDGKYQEVPATLEDIYNIFQFNRQYLPFDKIEDVLMRRRCPLDLTLYNPEATDGIE